MNPGAPDGLNGDCLVHYKGEHSEYQLMATLVNGKREGEAIILKNCIPIQKCNYKNGVLTGKAEELDEWERMLSIVSKRINPSYTNFSENDIFFYNTESESTHGITVTKDKTYIIDWYPSTNRVVIADSISEELIVYVNGNRADISYAKGVIDLDTKGRRWEGGVKNETPYGYGVLFNEEGRKEFEGWMMDGIKPVMEWNTVMILIELSLWVASITTNDMEREFAITVMALLIIVVCGRTINHTCSDQMVH